jgi:hypothetical protein
VPRGDRKAVRRELERIQPVAVQVRVGLAHHLFAHVVAGAHNDIEHGRYIVEPVARRSSAPVLPLLSTALLRNSLFAKIIVVKGKSSFAPEFDQRNTKRNQRTYEQ